MGAESKWTSAIVDHRRLKPPLRPQLFIRNQFSHETADIDPTGSTGVENRTTQRRFLQFICALSIFIDQAVRADRNPRYPLILAANGMDQIICRIDIITMRWQKQLKQEKDNSLPGGILFTGETIGLGGCTHENKPYRATRYGRGGLTNPFYRFEYQTAGIAE